MSKNATLMYSMICDDVRLEVGSKISLMGIFQNVFLPAFPATLVKFAVVNHWEGNGQYETQVKILNPDGTEMMAAAPSQFSVEQPGFADNITFFTNVTFNRAGTYTVQILLDRRPVADRHLYVQLMPQPPSSGTVN